MKTSPSLFVTNFNPRFTGVSATTAAVFNVHKTNLNASLVGKPLYGCPQPLSKREAIKLSWTQPKSYPFNIWHVRRNPEMQLAIFARDVLRLPIRIVFTSAAQRRHSAWPRWLISRMDAVIATSEEAAKFVPNVVSITPHGVDLNRFSPAKNQKESWFKTGLPGDYGIINIGRIRPEKGTDLFVEAMIETLPKLPRATAIIAGQAKQKDASFKRKLETRIEQAGLSKRILFIGEVQPVDLPNLLRGSKLLVALPRYEGFGLTPLEAMACGLPIIASNTGHFEEFANTEHPNKASGKIVSIGDSQTASKEIFNLLSDPLAYSQFSQNALTHVTKNYSVEKEAHAIQKVYQRLWNGEIGQ